MMDATELWPAPARRERWLRLIELLDPQPAERILDVGCGRGLAVTYLAEQVGPQGQVVGVDSQERLVADAESALAARGLTQAQAIVADAAQLPFADASFDALLCVNVLEAIPDRERVLAEFRRVVRPGGRVLVAHDDHESQAYIAADRELCRRAVRTYADMQFATYDAHDPQMGRRLWGLFRRAGFGNAQLHVLTLVETEYAPPHMGWSLSQFSADAVAVSGLTEDELKRWRADLAEQSARCEYLYSINLYVCLGCC